MRREYNVAWETTGEWAIDWIFYTRKLAIKEALRLKKQTGKNCIVWRINADSERGDTWPVFLTSQVPGLGRKRAKATPTGSVYFPLFEHLSREHGLTLLDSELAEIVRIAATLPPIAQERHELREACFVFLEAIKHDGYGMRDAEKAARAALDWPNLQAEAPGSNTPTNTDHAPNS